MNAVSSAPLVHTVRTGFDSSEASDVHTRPSSPSGSTLFSVLLGLLPTVYHTPTSCKSNT
eukprot:351314-Chlamydomonas_euryale.AAC.6